MKDSKILALALATGLILANNPATALAADTDLTPSELESLLEENKEEIKELGDTEEPEEETETEIQGEMVWVLDENDQEVEYLTPAESTYINRDDKVIEATEAFDHSEFVDFDYIIKSDAPAYIDKATLEDSEGLAEIKEDTDIHVSTNPSEEDLVAEDLGYDFNVELLDHKLTEAELTDNYNKLEKPKALTDMTANNYIIEDLQKIYAKAYKNKDGDNIDVSAIIERAIDYGFTFRDLDDVENFIKHIEYVSKAYLDDNQNDTSREIFVDHDTIEYTTDSEGNIIPTKVILRLDNITEANKKSDTITDENLMRKILIMSDEQSKEVDEAIDKIVEKTKTATTQKEKAEIIAREIVTDNLYSKIYLDFETQEVNPDNTYNHNAYGALIDKESVCQGFADAYTMAMRKTGIPAYTVIGWRNQADFEINESHAWNLVYVDGKWSWVDLTNMISYEDSKLSAFAADSFLQARSSETFQDYIVETTYYYFQANNDGKLPQQEYIFEVSEEEGLAGYKKIDAADLLAKFVENDPTSIDYDYIRKILEEKYPQENKVEPTAEVETSRSVRVEEGSVEIEKDIIYVSKGYKYIKEGFYKKTDLEKRYQDLEKEIIRTQRIMDAVKKVQATNPKISTARKAELDNILKEAYTQNKEAKEALAELKVILKK